MFKKVVGYFDDFSGMDESWQIDLLLWRRRESSVSRRINFGRPISMASFWTSGNVNTNTKEQGPTDLRTYGPTDLRTYLRHPTFIQTIQHYDSIYLFNLFIYQKKYPRHTYSFTHTHIYTVYIQYIYTVYIYNTCTFSNQAPPQSSITNYSLDWNWYLLSIYWVTIDIYSIVFYNSCSFGRESTWQFALIFPTHTGYYVFHIDFINA